ncbi:MAG TPA: stage II sporulation protein M [Anaerolineae bacterium]|nr:stage II sporulation protein M [Anaerolineae bacterium]
MRVVDTFRLVTRALRRAYLPITSFLLVYFIAVLVGIRMVHSGSDLALSFRDDLIAKAQASQILQSYHEGSRFKAAFLDFGENLLVAFANTISGLSILVPYPIAAFRGWVVGIVSVDSSHASRLVEFGDAFYYLSTVFLQMIPYSLAGGAGVHLGLSYIFPKPYYEGEKWLRLPKEAIRDVLRIFALVVPLFLIASLWEFLSA